MNRIKYILFLLLFIPFSNVFASGSIDLSTTNLTITKGDTITFKINATNLAGNVLIESSNSNVVTVDQSSYFFDTTLNASSVTVTVSGLNIGSASVNIILDDVATFDGEELTGTKVVSVNVTEPPVVVEKEPEPEVIPAPEKQEEPIPQVNDQESKQETTNNNVNNQSSTQEPTKETENKNEQVVEEPKQEEVTNDVKEPEVQEEVEEKVDITKFEILGYDINFKENVYNYSIDIPKLLNKLYITVEGNDIEVTGDGIVDIEYKDVTVVSVKYKDKEYNYVIKLNRIANNLISSNKKSNNNLFLMIVSTVSLIINVVLSIIILKNKKGSNKNETTEEEIHNTRDNTDSTL